MCVTIREKHIRMRFKLNIRFDTKPYGSKLPLNYQYELSAWIYKTLANGDLAYADWLHNNGFKKDGKQFRLFTFSNLILPRVRIEEDRIVLLSENGTLYISFLPERSTEEFVKGIFTSQSFVLGDKKSRVQCSIESIERLSQADLRSEMSFSTISPMVLSSHLPDGRTTYISPETPDASSILLNNLLSKYEAFHGKPFEPSKSPENNEHAHLIAFKTIGPVKRKKITIKSGTPQQTYIIGYSTKFHVKLPHELMHLLIETGIGEKGSMGFGMVEELKP